MRRIFRGNRNKLHIIAEILEQTRKPVRKTQIMRQCNLSYKQLTHYLSLTRKRGLVLREKNSEATTYHRTGKGKEFLRLYRNILLMMDKAID